MFQKTAKQKEQEKKNILRRAILKRGKINAFDDSGQKVNSMGIPIIENDLLRAQSDQNRFDLNHLQKRDRCSHDIDGTCPDNIRAQAKAGAHEKFQKNADKANQMVGCLNNFVNANWFWTIPVAALQKAADLHLHDHRELLLSLRGGERADAVEIVKQIEFDEDLEVSWESLTNLEYELLVEDEYISRQVVDLWLDYFVVHKKSTAPQIVSRKCCRYMSKIIQKKYSKKEIQRIWKTASTSRVYRKLLLRLGTETSIHRIKRSTLAAVGKARQKYKNDFRDGSDVEVQLQ